MRRLMAGGALITLGGAMIFSDFGDRGLGFQILLVLTLVTCGGVGAFLLLTAFGPLQRDEQPFPRSMTYLLGGALTLGGIPWVLIGSLGLDDSPWGFLRGFLAGAVTATGLLLVGLGVRATRAERGKAESAS
ncbi:MAG: hypothetical protein OXG74_08140 [Acidobacteria bacterium]|nr:hypothetical protein [Acidobacteriota bacterium]